MPEFTKYACWSGDVVQTTIMDDIGALGLDDDAVFLAAHTHFSLTQTKGAASKFSDERAVLQAVKKALKLGASGGQNTVIPIVGPSGSGKSHLVRWLKAQLDPQDEQYKILYVPRELKRLRDLLNRILDELGGSAAQAVREQLDQALEHRGPEELAEDLKDQIKQVLSFSPPEITQDSMRFVLGDPPIEGQRWAGGLGALLGYPAFADHLTRDGGTITALVESIRAEQRGRDTDLPEFGSTDLPEAAGHWAAVERAVGDNPDLVRLTKQLRSNPEPAVVALNGAVKLAIHRVLGLTAGSGLEDVFEDARRKLRKKDRQLVLLFEDLALFSLVDGAIFNQMRQQPSDDLAPLRVVYAITDGKYDTTVPEGVKETEAYHFRLAGIPFEEVDNTSGENADGPLDFVARYLNVARVGRKRLKAEFAKASPRARRDGNWIPNACLKCEFKPECHASTAFGTRTIGKSEIGLYPYNHAALSSALRKTRSAHEALIPRRIVREVVRDVLVTSEVSIGQGEFPTQEETNRYFEWIPRRLQGEVVEDDANLSQADLDRVFRVRVLWAEHQKESDVIRAAFSLPDVGGGQAKPTVWEGDRREVQLDEGILPALLQWRTHVAIGDEKPRLLSDDVADAIRQTLREAVVARLELGIDLIAMHKPVPQRLLEEVLKVGSFRIESATGRIPPAETLTFDLPKTDDSVRLMWGAHWFREFGHWDPTDKSASVAWDPTQVGTVGEVSRLYESTLDRWANAVRDTVIERVRAAELARLSVQLRTFALRLTGAPMGEVESDGWARLFRENGLRRAGVTPNYKHLSAGSELAAKACLDDDPVVSFAAARQGNGDPIVIDAGSLLGAVESTWSDPVGVITSCDLPVDEWASDLRGPLQGIKELLSEDLLVEEATALSELLSSVLLECDEPLRELAPALRTAASGANDNGCFRPPGQFNEFIDRCRTLEAIELPVETLRTLARSLSENEVQDAVFRGQQFSLDLSLVDGELRAVRTGLEASLDEVQSRLRDSGTSSAVTRTSLNELLDRIGLLITQVAE